MVIVPRNMVVFASPHLSPKNGNNTARQRIEIIENFETKLNKSFSKNIEADNDKVGSSNLSS